MLIALPATFQSPPAGPTYDTSPAAKFGLVGTQTSLTPFYDAWDDPTKAQNVGQFAYVNANKNDNGSQILMLTGCGFNLPPGAVIDGIKVTWYYYGSQQTPGGKGANTYTASLIRNGVIESTNYATFTLWPTTATAVDYGGSTDLWGASWTAADVNNANFGVALAVGPTDAYNPDCFVGYGLPTIYFH